MLYRGLSLSLAPTRLPRTGEKRGRTGVDLVVAGTEDDGRFSPSTFLAKAHTPSTPPLFPFPLLGGGAIAIGIAPPVSPQASRTPFGPDWFGKRGGVAMVRILLLSILLSLSLSLSLSHYILARVWPIRGTPIPPLLLKNKKQMEKVTALSESTGAVLAEAQFPGRLASSSSASSSSSSTTTRRLHPALFAPLRLRFADEAAAREATHLRLQFFGLVGEPECVLPVPPELLGADGGYAGVRLALDMETRVWSWAKPGEGQGVGSESGHGGWEGNPSLFP